MEADIYPDSTRLIALPITCPILLCEGEDDRLHYVNVEEAALLSIQHLVGLDWSKDAVP